MRTRLVKITGKRGMREVATSLNRIKSGATSLLPQYINDHSPSPREFLGCVHTGKKPRKNTRKIFQAVHRAEKPLNVNGD